MMLPHTAPDEPERERRRVTTDQSPALDQAHLVIGLGGIGRSTIARLRRLLDHGVGQAAEALETTRFVAIDVDESLRGQETLAASLLRETHDDIFTLDMESVRALSSELQGEVREWLSRYDAAMEIGSDAATNPRRLGSLLLAAKSAELRSCLEMNAAALLKGGQGARSLHIHVVGYLAGGVGGGALTQLLVQVRRNVAMAGRSHVVVYGLLPAEEATGLESEAAAANTGAALTELSTPQRRVETRRDTAEPQDLGINRLCDEILVLAPPAETGRVSRDLRTLPEALAMAVRQRMLIGAPAAATRPQDQPGGARPIVAVAPKVLTTASDVIEDALALSFLQSALAQTIYANWTHRRGFISEPQELREHEYVRRPELQNRWLISADHLIQSSPILAEDLAGTGWRSLADDWAFAVEGYLDLARTQPRREWLDCITALAARRFQDGFRGVGVRAFYHERQARRRDIARRVRDQITTDLFNEWMAGERGLIDIHRILRALIDLHRERLASIEERIANIRLGEEACRVRILAAHQTWRRRAPRRWLPWNWFRAEPEDDLHIYGISVQELYVNQSRAEGWLFAKMLLPVLIEELERVAGDVQRLLRLLSAAARDVDFVLDGLSARLEETEGSGSFISHIFDAERVRSLVQEVLTNEPVQTRFARRLREALGAGDEAQAGFQGAEGEAWIKRFATRLRGELKDLKGGIGTEIRNILATSIYDILEDRTGGDFSRLRELATQFGRQAAALLPGVAEADLPTRLYVILPRLEGRTTFLKTLKLAFSFDQRCDISFVETDLDDNTIHLLMTTAPFSVPDVELLRQMDQQYRRHLQRGRDHAALSMHTLAAGPDDGAAGTDAASSHWIVPTAHVLLGYPLALIVEGTAGDTGGRRPIWLVPKDGDGFDENPILLAGDLLSAPVEVTGPMASILEDNVLRALNAFAGNRGALIDAIVERVAIVRRRCGDNPADPVYRAFVTAGKAAAALARGQPG